MMNTMVYQNTLFDLVTLAIPDSNFDEVINPASNYYIAPRREEKESAALILLGLAALAIILGG
jgi:hypothetical protein